MIVYINNTSNQTYDLDLLSRDISAPEAKTYTVDIPYSDSNLDLTDYYGSVKYNNRTITLTFEIRKQRAEWMSLMSTLRNAYHGKTVNLIFNDDSSYYWTGRCSVDDMEDHGYTAGLTMTFDVKPYKYPVDETGEASL